MVPNAAAGIDLRLETYEQSMVLCRRNKYLYLLKISPVGVGVLVAFLIRLDTQAIRDRKVVS